jgi:putative methyltransferase (TIGR04325 family)
MSIPMPLLHALKQVLPPVLTNALRRLRPPQPPAPAEPEEAASPAVEVKPDWEYVPDGWRLHDPNVKGWDVASVVATQRHKWTTFTEFVAGPGPLGIAHEGSAADRHNLPAHNTIMAFGYVLGRAGACSGRLSVLDWGGGIGNYYRFARALWPRCVFDYTSKDVPLTVQAGRELGVGCTFEDDDDRALSRIYDLVMASASLHYSEDWQGLVARLCGAASRYLFVTRLPIVEEVPSFVVVQRPYAYGYLTEYLCWFLNRSEFITEVEKNGFRLEREFLLDERPIVASAPEQCRYAGFLFERTGAASAG